MPGIQKAVGIEGAFDALLLIEIVLGEHGAHQVALFDADAVFAGQDTPPTSTQSLRISAPSFLRAFQVVRLAGVIHDEGMQVAVTGMEDVDDAKPELFRKLRSCAASTSARRPRGMVPSMQK